MPFHAPQPEFETLDVVLVGGFNPAIFHPQWFLRHKLIGEEAATEAVVNVVSTDVTEVSFAGVTVKCFHQQLIISTQNVAFTERVRDLAEGILVLLPHLPITAFGINPRAHYRVEDQEYWHTVGHTLAPKELVWDELYAQPGYSRPGMHTLTIQAHRTDEIGKINVTVQPSKRFEKSGRVGVMIYANNHFDVSDDLRQDDAAAVYAKQVINDCWADSCFEARRVAERLFSKITPNQ